MKKLVILISPDGLGSNLQAILKAVKSKRIKATIQVVISESDSAPGLNFAREEKIPIAISRNKTELSYLLAKLKPEYIALCGWRQIIPDDVLKTYENKILNLHPGVIPDDINVAFKNPDGSNGVWNKGLYADVAVQKILDSKATYAGSSIHFLSAEFDFGVVLGRTFEKIEPNDTIQSLYTRLKKKEHELYVEVLEKLCNE